MQFQYFAPQHADGGPRTAPGWVPAWEIRGPPGPEPR